MTALAAFALTGDQGTLVVEVDEPDPDRLRRVSRLEDGLLRANQTLDAALANIRPVALAVGRVLQEVAPDEAEVEMAFKLTAETGVILAKVVGEAHLKVKIAWKRRQAPGG
jgi:hypothetical protein